MSPESVGGSLILKDSVMLKYRPNSRLFLLSFVLNALLSGCGGGGGDSVGSTAPVTITGKVADGYLVGAKVCVDLNTNRKCDVSEPFAITTQGGNYSIELPINININDYSMIAEVVPGVVDEDDGKAIDKGYVLSTPADKSTFISPISSLVHTLKASENLTTQQAAEKLKLKLGIETNIDLFANYIDSNELTPSLKTKIHAVAKLSAKIMADNSDPIMLAIKTSNLSNDATVESITETINLHIIGQIEVINEIASDVSDQAKIDDSLLQSLDATILLEDLYKVTGWDSNAILSFETNLATTGAGSTIELPVNNGKVCSGDTGTEKSTLSGLKYCINIDDNNQITRFFDVSTEKQNTLIYLENLNSKVKFALFQKVNGVFTEIDLPLFKSVPSGRVYQFKDIDAFRLQQGAYKIVFKMGSWFASNATAEIHINSDTIDRVYTEGVLLVKAKVAPYELTVGQQVSIPGTLQPIQDDDFNGTLLDVIPLRTSNQTASVQLKLASSQELDVKVVNAAYLSKVLFPSIVLPQDGVLWQGKSTSLDSQSFVFTKQTAEDAYYVVISTPYTETVLDSYKLIPSYRSYKLTAITQSIKPAVFDVSTESYKINWANLSLTAIISNIEILKQNGSNNWANIPDNEFLTTISDAKDLTSALQTLHAVMSFDEGSVMRFYDDYMHSIDAVHNSAEALYVTEELTSLAINVFQVLKKAGEGKEAALDLTSQLKQLSLHLLDRSQNERAKELGSIFLQYGFNVLREYQQKKALFMDSYQTGYSIVALDRLSIDTVSELTKLYILQQRANLFIQYGMNVYLSTTNLENRTLLEYFRDRIVAITSAFIPDGAGKKTIEALSNIDVYTKALYDIGKDQFALSQIEVTMEQMWNSFLAVDNYHSFYTPEVQQNNIALLIQKGLEFDLEPPIITLKGNDPENIIKNTDYIDTGASATDAVDGIINVTHAGTVDSSTVGTYTITYNAIDKAGNKATTTRTVNVNAVADITKPVNLQTIAGNNQATVSWDPVAGADSYNVYIAEETGLTAANISVYGGGTEYTAVSSPYVISSLTNGQPYFIVVTSVNSGGESADSNEVSFTPQVSSGVDATGWTELLSIEASHGNTITTDSIGNVYIAGKVYGELFSAKYDSNGIQQWVKVITNVFSVSSIVVDSSGSVLIGGTIHGTSFNGIEYDIAIDTHHGFLIKLDNAGNTLWSHAIGGDNVEVLYSLALDNDNNIYGTGYSRSTTFNGDLISSTFDVFTISFDTDGNLRWSQLYSQGQYQTPRSIKIDNAGNTYVTGGTYLANKYDMFIVKYDKDGVFQWDQTLDPNSNGSEGGQQSFIDDVGNISVILSSSSDYFDGYSVPMHGLYSHFGYFIIKFNAQGNKLWSKPLSSNSLNLFKNIYFSFDEVGNIYTSGYGDFNPGIFDGTPSYGGNDLLFMKHDIDGQWEWSHRIGGSGIDYPGVPNDKGTSPLSVYAGNIFLTGITHSPVFEGNLNPYTGNSSGDAFIIKLKDLSASVPQ